MNSHRCITSCVLATLLCGTAAFAQETREEAQRQPREEKQQNVEPYEPNFLERALKAIETGIHPDFPSWASPVTVYFRRTTGGWQLVGLTR